jgi:hypothetical protein
MSATSNVFYLLAKVGVLIKKVKYLSVAWITTPIRHDIVQLVEKRAIELLA